MINLVESQKEHILLVECDPQVSELIAEQTLRPLGYQVDVIETASTAIKDINNIAPDLLLINLYLPEISGKDLMIALSSQGVNIPIIVIAPRGHESDVLQALRLGADNFLTHPLREAEVVEVVEDTLSRSRKQYELDSYSRQVDQIREEMGQHARDLIEIFSIGKIVPSAANQQSLYDKVTNAAALVTRADTAWMLVFDFNKKKHILRACLNADEELESKLNLPYEDHLSSLVTVSGQILTFSGEALRPFNLPGSLEAIMVMPIKWKDELIGMLVVARKKDQPFTSDQQEKLEMVAGYASALLENSRRFQILEQRLFFLEQSSLNMKIDSDMKNDLLRQASLELRNPLKNLMEYLVLLSNLHDRRLSLKQADALNAIQEEADILMDIADGMVRLPQRDDLRILEKVNLCEIVRDVVGRFQEIAQVSRISINLELPSLPAMVTIFPSQITKVIEGLVSNALKYSPAKAEITIHVDQRKDCTTLIVSNQGEGINEDLVERLFDRKSSLFGEEARRFGGIGISLPMIKEIISAHRGEIGVESGSGKGFTVTFSLPQ